jgi:hypothetical protein
MVIRTQDESAIYDLSKMSSVYTNEDGIIYALGYTGELAYPLGQYATQERAKEVVEEIYSLFEAQSRYDLPVV